MPVSESGKSNQLIQADTISRFKHHGWSNFYEERTKEIFLSFQENPPTRAAYLITCFLTFQEHQGVTK